METKQTFNSRELAQAAGVRRGTIDYLCAYDILPKTLYVSAGRGRARNFSAAAIDWIKAWKSCVKSEKVSE